MKQKLKKILLLFLFSGTLFVSCELQEDAVHQHEHNSNLKLYEMKFEELMTSKKFVNSFSKLPKSKKSVANATLGRTVMEDEYGFTIANKPAKVIENNGNISYTFLITRNSTNSDSFENLVIQTDSLNITKAVIIKYNLTSPITTAEDNSYTFTSNSEITPIVYNNTAVNESSKEIITCYWILTLYCNYGGNEHVAGPNCTPSYTYNTYKEQCYNWFDGPMDNNGGGGGSTTGTGSNYDGSNTSIHGNGSNSVNTAPVAPEIDEEILTPQDLCNDLTAKDANPTFVANMQDLKTRAATQNVESAYVMFQNASAGLQFSPRQDGVSPQDAEVILTPYVDQSLTPTNSIGAIHCHLDNGTTFKIFSFADLLALAEFATVSSQPSAQFSIYVVTSSGTFCIKIKNKTHLRNRKDIMSYTQSLYEKKFDEFVKKNKPINKQVLGFLNFLKEEKFDQSIELFQKNETDNTWQKLKLSSNGRNVIPTNC